MNLNSKLLCIFRPALLVELIGLMEARKLYCKGSFTVLWSGPGEKVLSLVLTAGVNLPCK